MRHASPLLRLHRFLFCERIVFKKTRISATIMYHNYCLSKLIVQIIIYYKLYCLHFSKSTDAINTHNLIVFSDENFSAASPKLWNNLPSDISHCTSFMTI